MKTASTIVTTLIILLIYCNWGNTYIYKAVTLANIAMIITLAAACKLKNPRKIEKENRYYLLALVILAVATWGIHRWKEWREENPPDWNCSEASKK